MVVTFVQPVTGGPFGPGFGVDLDSDFIGPLPSGSFWLVWVATTDDPEDPIQSALIPTTSNAKSFVFGRDGLLGDPLIPATLDFAHGNTVSITASLQSPTAVLDEGTTTVTWDMASGVPFVLQEAIGAAAGLSVDQEAQLEEIDRVVHMDLGGLGRIGLSELVGLPSAGFTIRQTITPDRSGEGDLDRPGLGLDVAALGLEWEWVVIPPGNGSRSGAPLRQSRRVLDLQLVGTDGATNEYTRSFDSFDVEHLRYTFNPVGLTRIHYWIEPGSVVRFHWLILA